MLVDRVRSVVRIAPFARFWIGVVPFCAGAKFRITDGEVVGDFFFRDGVVVVTQFVFGVTEGLEEALEGNVSRSDDRHLPLTAKPIQKMQKSLPGR